MSRGKSLLTVDSYLCYIWYKVNKYRNTTMIIILCIYIYISYIILWNAYYISSLSNKKYETDIFYQI